MAWYDIVPTGSFARKRLMENPMTQLLMFAGHTPAWAYALFALLIVLGVQALRDRKLPLWRVLIVPAVFITWGLSSLLLQKTPSALLFADWIAAAGLGFGLGWATTVKGQFEVISTHVIAVKGSALPLFRNLAIFATKYLLTATMMMQPALRDTLAPWDIAVSGLSAGYFLGTLIHLLRAYRKAPADAAIRA